MVSKLAQDAATPKETVEEKMPEDHGLRRAVGLQPGVGDRP